MLRDFIHTDNRSKLTVWLSVSVIRQKVPVRESNTVSIRKLGRSVLSRRCNNWRRDGTTLFYRDLSLLSVTFQHFYSHSILQSHELLTVRRVTPTLSTPLLFIVYFGVMSYGTIQKPQIKPVLLFGTSENPSLRCNEQDSKVFLWNRWRTIYLKPNHTDFWFFLLPTHTTMSCPCNHQIRSYRHNHFTLLKLYVNFLLGSTNVSSIHPLSVHFYVGSPHQICTTYMFNL